MRVLLVTSWGNACGIAEHSKLLKASVEAADPGIEIYPSTGALDPSTAALVLVADRCDLVHLNHHDGLHSRWTAGHVQALTNVGMPVLVTYHDTRATLAECPKLAALAWVASSIVVHEPVEGLKAVYWRQGVPAAATAPAVYYEIPGHASWKDGHGVIYPYGEQWKAYPQQPVLGSVGFNFPWKNFDQLAKVTGEEGWALVLLSNNATEDDEARWRALNSSILVVRKFLPQDVVVNYLAGCDATAFMYECANTGTSAAIRQGIAARKPVIALETCRQFRDLYEDSLGHRLTWVDGWGEFRSWLNRTYPVRYDPAVCALAHRDSWTKVGENYSKLYHMLAAQ